MRYAHTDRGISRPHSFSSEQLCMQRSGEYLNNSNDKSGEIMASDDELGQRLLADEPSDKNEVTTIRIDLVDKSIKRLQSNSDTSLLHQRTK